MQLQLTWMPTESSHDLGTTAEQVFHGQTVSLSVVDTRQNTGRIGENREESEPRPVATTDNVAQFLGQNYATVLRQDGVQVVPSSATRILRIELAEFWVAEKNTYQGSIRLQVTLANGAGKVLWKGNAQGTSNRWGRSFEQENYLQTFSDASLDALRSLLMNTDFQAGVHSDV
jgi:hypothetical protein